MADVEQTAGNESTPEKSEETNFNNQQKGEVMAESKAVNLPFGQVTKITKGGTYQLVDETPDFLQTSYIEIDLSLVTEYTKFILPPSTDYVYGKSQQIYFTTIGESEFEIPKIEVFSYVPPKGVKTTIDRLNGKEFGSITGIGQDGLWYVVQLLAPTRWLAQSL